MRRRYREGYGWVRLVEILERLLQSRVQYGLGSEKFLQNVNGKSTYFLYRHLKVSLL
jgi:hypothetical protein